MKKLIILIVLLAGVSLFAQTNKIIREQDLEARLGDSLATGGGSFEQPLDTLEVTNDADIGGVLETDSSGIFNDLFYAYGGFGDVNGDLTMNATDLNNYYIPYLNGDSTLTEDEIMRGDINGDGKLDETDMELFTYMNGYNVLTPTIETIKDIALRSVHGESNSRAWDSFLVDDSLVVTNDADIGGNLDVDGGADIYNFVEGGLSADDVTQVNIIDTLLFRITKDDASPNVDNISSIRVNSTDIHLTNTSGDGAQTIQAEIQVSGGTNDKIVLDSDSTGVRGDLDVDGVITTPSLTLTDWGTSATWYSGGGAFAWLIGSNSGGTIRMDSVLSFMDGGNVKLMLRENEFYPITDGLIDIGRYNLEIDSFYVEDVKISNNLDVDGTVTIGAYTLPNTDGTTNYVLKTDGSGTASWQADATGGSPALLSDIGNVTETGLTNDDILQYVTDHWENQTFTEANIQEITPTLTDIKDGDIATNLTNTTFPWADNEVANNITIDLSTLATTVTVSDDETSDDNQEIVFTTTPTGTAGLEVDGDLHYNPNTGTVTATEFVGGGSGLTDVAAATGNNATGFFSSGTIEHERGGLEADVNAYDGLVGITGGATYNQTGTTTQIMIFDGAGAPTSAALSGDATMTNAGVVTVVDDSHAHLITNVDAFTESELEAQMSDVTSIFTNLSSGDVSIAGGTTVIGSDIVEESMLEIYGGAPADNEAIVWNASESKMEWVANVADSVHYIAYDYLLGAEDSIGNAIDDSSLAATRVGQFAFSQDGSTWTTSNDVPGNGEYLSWTTTGDSIIWQAGSGLTEEQVEDYVGGMVTGNTETNITVTYQDADGTLDFVVSGGAGDFLADGSVPMTADIDLDGNNVDNGGVIFLKEQADADADVAGSGQIWVNTATPNELWFTDDAGTDTQLGVGGSDDQTLAEVLASGADANDVNITSAAIIYGVDNDLNLNMGTDGVVSLNSNGTLALNSADWDISTTGTIINTAIDADNNTITNLGDGAIDNDITIDVATVGTTVTITDNESTAENNPLVFVAGADPDGGNLGLETDGTTHYNPSTGTITATEFVGGGSGLTGLAGAQDFADVLGEDPDGGDIDQTSLGKLEFYDAGLYLDADADGVMTIFSDGTLELASADWDISTTGTLTNTEWQGTAIADAYVPNDITIDLATLASTVTIADNESTDETNAVVFLPGGDLDGGNLALESDGTFNYNPSSGTVTTTEFVGGGVGLTGLAGDNIVDGSVDGSEIDESSLVLTELIDSDDYVDGSIDEAHMSANSIDSDSYVDASIDEAHLSDNSLDSDSYVDASIDLAHMSSQSVDSDNIVEGTILVGDMAANSIDSDQYVDASIDEVHMSDNSIDSRSYVDGSIDLAHMSADCIDSNQYVDGSIDYVHLAGSIPALTPVTDDADDFEANFTGANLYGGTFYCDGTGTIDLPTAAVGMNFTIITFGAIEVIIEPTATDLMYSDGTAQADEETLTNLSTTGDIAVVQYHSAVGWLVTTNGWTQE